MRTKLILLSILLLARTALAEPAISIVLQSGHPGGAAQTRFSPDGRRIATVGMGEDPYVRVWDTASGMLTAIIRTSGIFRGIAFLPNGQRLVAADGDGVLLADPASGAVERRIVISKCAVNGLDVSPDGRTLAVGCSEGDVRLADLASGAEKARVPATFPQNPAVRFSPDGRTLLAYGTFREGPTARELTAMLFDTRDPQRWMTLDLNHGEPTSAAFAPNSQTVAVAAGDEVRLFDARRGQMLHALPAEKAKLVSFSPDGKELVVFHGQAFDVFAPQTGQPVRHAAFRNAWYASAVSADHRYFTIADTRGPSALFDLKTLSPLQTFGAAFGGAAGIVGSVDATHFVALHDRSIRAWDLARVEPAWTVPEFSRVAALSGDGNLLAYASNVGVTIVDARTGQQRKTLAVQGQVNGLSLSGDGKLVAIVANAGIDVRQVETGAVVEHVPETEFIHSVRFDGSGQQLLVYTLGSDPRLRRWSLTAHREVSSVAAQGFLLSGDGGTVLSWDYNRLTVERLNGGGPQVFPTTSLALQTQVAVSADGSELATTDMDGKLTLWKPSGEPVLSEPVRTDARESAYSRDGRWLFILARDGGLHVWDRKAKHEALLLAGLDQEDYFAATPEGYYMVSPGAFKGVAFRMGDGVYPFDQFDLQLNRPDKVLAATGLAPAALIKAYEERHAKRVQKLKAADDGLAGLANLPTLTVATDGVPVKTPERHVQLPLTARDGAHLITKLLVYVNGVPMADVPAVAGAGVHELQQTLDVELSHGRNSIEISALNNAGQESLRRQVTVYSDAPRKPATLYVLAIGVSKYGSAEYDLTYAAKDAGDLAAAIEKHKSGFAQVKVKRLLDREATRKNILDAHTFLKDAGVDDEVIVFVAGHGLLDDKLDYYFGNADIDFAHPAKKGIAYAELEGLLTETRARKKLLLMDTCFSGEVESAAPAGPALAAADGTIKVRAVKTRGIRKSSGAPLATSDARVLLSGYFADLRRGSGAMVISSAGGAEYALESPTWHNGVFTYAILDALQSNDPLQSSDFLQSGDGTFVAHVMVTALRDRVVSSVRKLTGGQQTPTARAQNAYDFDLFAQQDVTGFLRAASSGDLAAVQRLISEGADVNAGTTYDFPLSVARTTEIFKLLLESGADPNAYNGRLVNDLLSWNSLDRVKLVVAHGGKLPASALGLAAGASTDAHELIDYLLAQGFKVNDPDNQGYTPIMHAIAGLEIPFANFQTLVNKGARLDAKVHGLTLVALAAQSGRSDLIEWLLAHGVPAESVDDEGVTPLMWAAQSVGESTDKPRAPGDVSPNPLASVRVLLAHGANVNARSKNGTSVLDFARPQKNEKVIKALQEAGAK